MIPSSREGGIVKKSLNLSRFLFHRPKNGIFLALRKDSKHYFVCRRTQFLLFQCLCFGHFRKQSTKAYIFTAYSRPKLTRALSLKVELISAKVFWTNFGCRQIGPKWRGPWSGKGSHSRRGCSLLKFTPVHWGEVVLIRKKVVEIFKKARSTKIVKSWVLICLEKSSF